MQRTVSFLGSTIPTLAIQARLGPVYREAFMQVDTGGTITRQDFQALELHHQQHRLCSVWQSAQHTAKLIYNVMPSSVQAVVPEPFVNAPIISQWQGCCLVAFPLPAEAGSLQARIL